MSHLSPLNFAAIVAVSLVGCGPIYVANGPACPAGTTWDGTQCATPGSPSGPTPVCPSSYAWNGTACAPAATTAPAAPPAPVASAPDPGTCPAASHWDGVRCAGDLAPSCLPGARFVAGTGCVAGNPGHQGHHPHHATQVADRFWVTPALTQDDRTGLTWARAISPGVMQFREAQSYCGTVGVEGNGWRLPTKDELLTIVETGHRPTTPLAAFPDTPPAQFWTSTSAVGSIMTTVSFESGGTESSPSGIAQRARCVRKTR